MHQTEMNCGRVNVLSRYSRIYVHCVSKNIPDIFDCNLRTNHQILIIFGRNIPDTTCHQRSANLSSSYDR